MQAGVTIGHPDTLLCCCATLAPAPSPLAPLFPPLIIPGHELLPTYDPTTSPRPYRPSLMQSPITSPVVFQFFFPFASAKCKFGNLCLWFERLFSSVWMFCHCRRIINISRNWLSDSFNWFLLRFGWLSTCFQQIQHHNPKKLWCLMSELGLIFVLPGIGQLPRCSPSNFACILRVS